MKKILALILTIIMIASVFDLPVMAEEDAIVLTENFGKVKIQGKVQSNGSVAFAVRSAFGESETQDIIQYFVRNTAQDSGNGMELNPAFDFDPSQHLVSKTSSTFFENSSVYGGDERAPVELSGFGWIGASHGTTCAVTVTSTNHGVTYSAIGNVYKDPANIEWVLLRVSDKNKLVFISKDLKSGDYTKPTFYSEMGATLTNVNNAEDVITVDSYKSGQQLRPAYEMRKQDVYIVNGKDETLVEADGEVHEGDYVLVEEEYTIMNPAYVAQAIIDKKAKDGDYTENPNLAVGKELVTFNLQYIYNPDGTVISNWENTFHQNAKMTQFGGIQFNHNPTHIYLPNTKAFSKTAYDSAKNSLGTQTMDFSNIASASVYPNSNLGTEGWGKADYVPHRRLDLHADAQGKFTKMFTGGFLPVYDNVNETRLTNTSTAFYMYNSRKAYYHSVSSKLSSRVGDLTNHTLKGSGYKKYVFDFDGDGTASYYSVPYFSDGDNSRYMYFDLYKPGVTKKYDISSYLGTYTISELEKTENLEYNIDYETGILTVSSKNNSQTSADSLVLKAKYVGESIPAVEMKIRALPALYDVSLNEKLAEIAELMERVGAPEEDYATDLIAKYNSLVSQKAAYEQAIKDEAANADRVAGLNNRYEYVELYLFQDIFATYNERTAANWYGWSTGDVTAIWPFKGIINEITPKYPVSRSTSSDGWAMMIDLDGATNYPDAVSLKTNPKVSYDEELGRYIVNAENAKYKLGEIAEGKKGGNFATFAVTYDVQTNTIAEGLGIKEQELNTTVYPNVGTSKRMDKGIYPINKTGISAINLLLTTTQVKATGKDRAMRLPVTIEYEGGGSDNIALLVGTIGADFQDTVFAAPKTSTTYTDINTNKVVANTVLGKNVTNENITIPTVGGKLYLPEESFILATHMRHQKDYEFDGYVNSFSIPVDPAKTIKTITLENTAANVANYFTGSVESTPDTTSNIVFVPVEVEDASEDYNYYLHATRACGSTGIFAMTLTNETTWQDKIDALNTKIEALDVETTSKEKLDKIKAEINALLEANTNIVYVKDFSEAARTKITDIEEYLKTHFSEEDRLVMLAERTYNYIDIDPDVDIFASLKEIADISRFYKSVSGTSTQSLGTTTYNGETVFDWIPQTRSDGSAVTGKEIFYAKGLKGASDVFADHILLSESLTAPEGTTTVSAKRVDVDTSKSNKDYYIDGTSVRKEIKKTIDQSHIISRLDEEGYVTIANGDMQHKVGPLKTDDILSPNARSTVNGNAIVVTDAKGTSLDLMLITNDVNSAYYTSSKLGVYTTSFVKENGTATTLNSSNANSYVVPKAGLQQIVINYADGEKETKYMVSVNDTIATYQAWYSENPVENTIVYAPKYDAEGNKIVYDEKSFYINSAETDFKYLTKYNVKADNIAETMIQPEDIKFVNEDIFMSTKGKLAEVILNRQDAMINDAGRYAAIASIPLKNKPLASLTFTRKNDAALSAEHSIKIATDQKDGSGNVRAATAALVPVEIEGASDDYVYFAYCGRLGDGTFVVSATVSSSKADLVKAANEEILAAETAEEAEAVIVKYIDNLYTKYRDLSDEAKAYYEELTGSKGTIRLTAEGTGYKATAFTAEAANKPYTIILASYDDKDNFMSAQKIDGTTKDAIYYVQNFASVPEGTANVRAYLWKNFSTLTPLAGNIAEIEIK